MPSDFFSDRLLARVEALTPQEVEESRPADPTFLGGAGDVAARLDLILHHLAFTRSRASPRVELAGGVETVLRYFYR